VAGPPAVVELAMIGAALNESAGKNLDEVNHESCRLFAFEVDIAVSLRRFPMAVRFKLDRCGIRLSLQNWQQLPYDARVALVRKSTERSEDRVAYIEFLSMLGATYWGSSELDQFIPESPPAWTSTATLPDMVRTQVREFYGQVDLEGDAWSRLTDLERFALIKLSRPGHANRGARALFDELIFRPAQ
jgi:hypothetical protein